MSYCRWSSDNFTCDLYIYESVYDCWTIHVAQSRHVGPLPEYPNMLKLASGEIDLAEYRAMHDRWDAWTEEHGMEAINLPVSYDQPLSVKVTEEVASTGSASAHGVRQVWPFDAFASAPGGSDYKLTVSREGPGLSASRFIQSEFDEHAASSSALPINARTRYIIFDRPTRAT